ncbi:MAG: UbiA family prenyltransferase [Acidobacteria bacterium]|nr:UbiA family prenyltransferase [Acidobacteriota bacterium]
MSDGHVHTYIFRGVKYAFTSACAIFAGYLIQNKYLAQDGLALNELLILAIPVSTSVFFFTCYANRFHAKDSYLKPRGVLQAAFQKEALITFPFIEIPVIGVILLLISRYEPLPGKLLIAFSLYGGLFVLYGIFLTRYRTPEGTLPLVRHQLVWPVVLSIAIGLYSGISFSDLRASLAPLLPVGIILLLYLASVVFKWSKKLFVRTTLLSSLVITVFVVLTLIGIIPIPAWLTQYFSSILFCVAASAYLAVFEAWKITADIADVEEENKGAIKPDDQADTQASKSSQYAVATLTALMGSIWVLPFYFIFSDFGTVFLVSFVVHAFGSFVFWFYFGRDKYLLTFPWSLIKSIAGLVFLGILVVSTFFKQHISVPFMKGFASWTGLSIVLFFAAYPVTNLGRELNRLRKRSKKDGRPITFRLLGNRVNFTRLLCLLCVASCFIMTALLQAIDETSRVFFKAELAFQVYWGCIFFCFVFEILHFFDRTPTMAPLLRSLVGLLLVIRVITSLVIAAIVVLPSVGEGVEIGKAVMMALPFFLAAAGGFALNDYYDVAKDVINKPYRAIPSKRLGSRAVLATGVLLIAAALLVAFYVSGSKVELIMYCSSIAGVSLYNLFVKHLTLSKNFLTSAISTLPVLYVVVVLQYPSIYLLIPAATSMFLLGREWLMDIRDIKGDRSDGIRTLPMIIGAGLTAKISFCALILSAFILLPFAVSTWSAGNFLLLGVLLLSTVLLASLWSYDAGKHRRAIVLGLWLPMSCGILMLLR